MLPRRMYNEQRARFHLIQKIPPILVVDHVVNHVVDQLVDHIVDHVEETHAKSHFHAKQDFMKLSLSKSRSDGVTLIVHYMHY